MAARKRPVRRTRLSRSARATEERGKAIIGCGCLIVAMFGVLILTGLTILVWRAVFGA